MDILLIAKYCDAQISTTFTHNTVIQNITLDSRKVVNGSLFVAVRGDNHDGHDYVANVVANSNCYALVNKDFTPDLPNLLRVEDTTKALGLIAAGYRQQFAIPVVAITGSNGKTTVKEMLRSICNAQFGEDKVLATAGNLNNHWGMPQTLLQLESRHKVAIIEMGMNHAGELDYLSHLAQPTIAVVNNVMFAHAGHFSGLADIASAKGEVYHGIAKDGIACVNASNEFAPQWLKNDISVPVYLFGTQNSQCYIKEQRDNSAIYITPNGEVEIKLAILGQHNYANALTAIAVALNIGCSLDNIKFGLENYHGYKGRLEPKTAFNGALIIDDTYNANPDSVYAAISAIQDLPKPHWFIFGDLKELGTEELRHHAEIAKYAFIHGIDNLITVGKLTKVAHENFVGNKIHFEDNMDVVKYCTLHLPKDGTVLVKGSNSTRLFDIVNKLVVTTE